MTKWARGVDFKNSNNTKRIGGIGVYGDDANAEKLYIGLGAEPWNNKGLQLTNSTINFKEHRIYHEGDKPTAAEIGAANISHQHSMLTGINDTRTTDYTPDTAKNDFKVTFQWSGSNDLNDGGNFYSLMHIPRWTDASGGFGSQVAFTDNENIWHRKGTSDTTWTQWNKVWHSGNFNPDIKFQSGGTYATLYLTDWFRARGNTGLYFEDYNGGWHMTDTTWVRSFAGKNVHTDGVMNATNGFLWNGESLDSRYAASSHNHAVIDGYHLGNILPLKSNRDFLKGTLITTNIPSSDGIPFLIYITGNSYTNIVPFDIKIQGYQYGGTVINYGGISNGTGCLKSISCFSLDGKLCFWFDRISYWQGFSVRAIRVAYAGTEKNEIADITDTTKPTNITREVTIPITQSYTTSFKPSPADIGAADASHSHSYLPLSGGTLTSNLTAPVLYMTDQNGYRHSKLGVNDDHIIGVDSGIVYLGNPEARTQIESNVDPTVLVGGKLHTMYHTGNKPSCSDIGAATASHNHGLVHDTLTAHIPENSPDNGWSLLHPSYHGYMLKSIRTELYAPSWILGNYSSGIAFGGGDTKGVLSVGHHYPSIRFAGGNGNKPIWHMSLTGAPGKTYDMDSFASTSHDHEFLTGVRSISFASEETDSVSMGVLVDGYNSYMDFNLADDLGDMWRWRFTTVTQPVFNAMTLQALSGTTSRLTVAGEIHNAGDIVTHNGTSALSYNLLRTADSGARKGQTWMTEILTTGRGTSYIGNRPEGTSKGYNGTDFRNRVSHIQLDYDDIIMGAKVSVKPYDPNGQSLGTSAYPWKEVYCTRGVFNGSDSKLKENIKKIENSKLVTYDSDNNAETLTSNDLYEYVKNSSLYSFNYKNSDQNILGILADEIPDNIFNKIGTIAEDENSIMDGIKLINASSQIAILQNVLGQTINKIEEQQQLINKKDEEVSELKEELKLIKEKLGLQ